MPVLQNFITNMVLEIEVVIWTRAEKVKKLLPHIYIFSPMNYDENSLSVSTIFLMIIYIKIRNFALNWGHSRPKHCSSDLHYFRLNATT